MSENLICGAYAHELYTTAKNWLVTHGPTTDITLDSTRLAGHGRMDDIGPAKCPSVIVGIGGVANSRTAFFRPGEAMLPLVSLFHEAAGHAMQVSREFRGRSRLQKALFYSHYACKGSRRYYGIDDDGIAHAAYFKHPHEIAAQYAGLKCAKTWLSYAVGEETAEAWLLDYVALRKERQSACPGEDASHGSIDAVLSAMDAGFQRSLDEPRLFDPEPEDRDSLSLFDAKRPNQDISSIVRTCGSGMRTDGMMAVAWIEWTSAMPGSDDMREFVLSTPIGKDLWKHGGHMFTGTGSPVFPPTYVRSPSMQKLFMLAGKMTADNVPRIPYTNPDANAKPDGPDV